MMTARFSGLRTMCWSFARLLDKENDVATAIQRRGLGYAAAARLGLHATLVARYPRSFLQLTNALINPNM